MRSVTITCSVLAVLQLFFFSSSVPSLLQRKILFEVLGHGASKQNYNLKHKVPVTWISPRLLKVANSNAISPKKMIKNNNELSVSSAFFEDWWDKLQSETVKSWSKNAFITFLKSMQVPAMYSSRQHGPSEWFDPTSSEASSSPKRQWRRLKHIL